MRILHILDHALPLHSGYAFRTRSILREQQALGWDTFHLTGSRQGKCDQPDEWIDELHFYRTSRSGNLLMRLPVLRHAEVIDGLMRRMAALIPRIKPDVLHAHSPSLNAIAALRIGKQFGIPVLYEVRAFWEDAAVDHGTTSEDGVRYRLTRALETHALRRAGAVTTICEGLRRDIVARGIAAQKVTVIPNAVDIGQFSMGGTADPALRQKLGLQQMRLIGFIGSFYAYEGLDILLRAMPAMLARDARVRLLLVGGGPQEQQLRQLANQLKVRDKVIFTGRVPHEQVQRYYDLIDVLVYPRLPMRLTELVTPLKPLEAMAQGRVLAASDVGGHRELIEHGANGILFAAGDPASLAEQVSALLADAQRWPALRANARRLVETTRNWRASVAGYAPIYAALAGKP